MRQILLKLLTNTTKAKIAFMNSTVYFSVLYFAEMISIVLKKEADSGTMVAAWASRIMFGLQFKVLHCDTYIGFLGKDTHP